MNRTGSSLIHVRFRIGAATQFGVPFLLNVAAPGCPRGCKEMSLRSVCLLALFLALSNAK